MAGHPPGDKPTKTPSRPARLRDSNSAVTPVLGTILILGITVLGTTGILLWGAPTIQGIQDRNAMVSMEGEFIDLRQSTLVLRVVDSSRVPVVPVPDGEFGIEAGSRFAVHAVYDLAPPECKFHVTDWHQPGNSVEVLVDGCGEPDDIDLRLDQVLGGTSRTIASTWDQDGGTLTADDAGVNLARGDWRISIVAGDERHADAYLLSTNRLVWSHTSSVNEMSLLLEGGAVFRISNGVPFLVRDPLIMEESFGSGDYLLRMPTYVGDRLTSVTGGLTVQTYLQLQGNHIRSAGPDAHHIRYTFSGDLAEAWCELMLLRNDRLPDTPYEVDSTYPCNGSGTDGLTSVAYRLGTPFSFEFIHARVFATVTV